MHIYGMQYDFMHRSCWNHSNFENSWFYHVIWTSDPQNHCFLGPRNRVAVNFLNRYVLYWVVPCERARPELSEYVWQRGVGGQKCLVLGNFQSVPRYRKRTDQILTKAARNQALLTPYPTLPYIFWTLWIWGITGTPYSWVKNAPSTAAKQILLKFSAIVGH